MRFLLALLLSLPFLLPTHLPAQDSVDAKADGAHRSEDPRIERFRQYLKAHEKVLGGRVVPNWMGDGDDFWYTDEVDGTWKITPETGKRVALPSPPALAAAAEPRVIREALFPGMPPIRELPSPDGRWAATEHQNDLWLRSSQDQRLVRLTTDGNEQRPWLIEQDDQWNRSRWSPDSLYLAAVREDRRHVPREPLVHWLKTHAEVQFFPMAKAGEPLPTTELWVFDARAKRGLRVDTLPGEAYFHFLGFQKQELLYLRASRDFKKVLIRAANVRTGETRTLLEEHQKTFIKNLSINPSWVELFTLLPQSNQFLWTSERDGWDHLYLYDLQGTLRRRLTQGEFPVLHVVAVDEASGWVYFTAHSDLERPYDTHLYRVSLKGGEMQQLTQEPGQHEITFTPSKGYFLDRHYDIDRAPAVDLRRVDGRQVLELAKADISGLQELGWQPPEPFVVLAADGKTPLHGLLFKPANLDPTKSYPVIEHIYGGPFTTYVPRRFAPAGWSGTMAPSLAQLGYITIMLDGRGTPQRGKAFQDVVFRRFGQFEIRDHAAALRQLAADRPYMDLDRVGVFGGSWGAYMTVRALLTAPELYKVGIATNGVYDFYDHGATGLEGYLELPQDNPEGYEAGSNFAIADQLEGQLMLIHATSDVNATFSATMKMADALIRAGKFFDLLVVPDQHHHLRGYAYDYSIEVHRRFFAEHLQP